MRERSEEASEASMARDAEEARPPDTNGFHHRESSESEVESAAGSSFASAGPDMSRRKTRSANLDDVIPQQRAGGDARPHSYAHGRHPPRSLPLHYPCFFWHLCTVLGIEEGGGRGRW